MNKSYTKHRLFISLLVLLCLTLLGCEKKPEQVSLQRILERGYLSVGTLFGPTSYYLDAEAATGFEYELAKMYADSLGVKLKVFPSYSLEELFFKLDTGQVDLLAAGLAVTPERLKRYKFSPSYESVSQKLVFKQGNKRPRKVKNLTGKLMVTEGSSHTENLAVLKEEHPQLTWQETADLDSEELLLKVLDGSIDYTVIDSNVLAVNRRYYPEISIGFTIKQPEPLAWVIQKSSEHSIMASLVEFFGRVQSDGSLRALDDKYYGHVEEFNYVDTRMFIQAVEKKLPKYKPLFKKYSDDIDWRLIAAISYQESHWQPHARSYTGVRGMMMLTLVTAKQMGVTSRLDAEQSIRGGAKYFRRMVSRMPARIPSPDNFWFALASYNVGLGHLNDARKITEQQGGDPDRWVEVKSRLPLLKQKKYYKKTKYGYARGDEAVNYVENIRRYYDTLSWMDDNYEKEKQYLKQRAEEAKALAESRDEHEGAEGAVIENSETQGG